MIARRTADRVFVTQGIADGEKVILTKLDMPILGMNLELFKTSEQGEELIRLIEFMQKSIKWFSGNHVAANFLMLAVLLAGFAAWFPAP